MPDRNFQSWHPVLGVASMKEALDFYVDSLGFQIDGEWEEAPGEPKIAWVSRDGMEIALNEHPDMPSNAWLNIKVADARNGLVSSWHTRSTTLRNGGICGYPSCTSYSHFRHVRLGRVSVQY